MREKSAFYKNLHIYELQIYRYTLFYLCFFKFLTIQRIAHHTQAVGSKCGWRKIVAEAPAKNGLIYALQSLRQIITNNNGTSKVPTCIIKDEPAFAWRAFMDILKQIAIEEVCNGAPVAFGLGYFGRLVKRAP